MEEARRDSDGSGRARSIWIKRKQIFVNANSTGGVLEGGQSSEYEEKPKRTKIEPKRVKLMRKPKKAKIESKRAKLMRKPKRLK